MSLDKDLFCLIHDVHKSNDVVKEQQSCTKQFSVHVVHSRQIRFPLRQFPREDILSRTLYPTALLWGTFCSGFQGGAKQPLGHLRGKYPAGEIERSEFYLDDLLTLLRQRYHRI